MIRRSGSWCIGRCAGRNCAIPVCAPTRRRMMASGATIARWTAWTPPSVRRRGLLIRRALDLMGALKLGVHIGLDEIRADEFYAMLIIAEERDLLERERQRRSG